MAKDSYKIDDFSFRSRRNYERALKEKETIAYLQANTKPDDSKGLLKIYNRSIEKGAFRTVIGLEYLLAVRKQLIASGIVSEEALALVPVPASASQAGSQDTDGLERQVKRYKAAYESARSGRIIKNMTIVILSLVIAAFLLITYMTRYSVFTYFTDYKENMREELIDEYEEWEKQLNEKEEELNDREAALQKP